MSGRRSSSSDGSPTGKDVNGALAIIRNLVQPQNYLDWRARNTSFDGIAALQGLPMNVSGSGDAEQVPGLRVSGEVFAVLGVSPLRGRGIKRGEEAPGRGQHRKRNDEDERRGEPESVANQRAVRAKCDGQKCER